MGLIGRFVAAHRDGMSVDRSRAPIVARGGSFIFE